MTGPRRTEKKSEMIEVRISHSQKMALSALCETQGRSLSETVRSLIDGELAGAARHVPDNRLRTEPMTTLIKTRPRALAASIIASAGALSVVLAAPSSAGPSGPAFDAIDLDRNQQIELHEFMEAAADGGLSLQPSASRGDRAFEQYVHLEFVRYDRNADNAISPDEFSGRYIPLMEASFHALDVNHDGGISVDELSYTLARGGVQSEHAALPEGPQQLAERYVRELDSDGDASLNLAEFMANN